jgi:hypothetical protein
MLVTFNMNPRFGTRRKGWPLNAARWVLTLFSFAKYYPSVHYAGTGCVYYNGFRSICCIGFSVTVYEVGGRALHQNPGLACRRIDSSLVSGSSRTLLQAQTGEYDQRLRAVSRTVSPRGSCFFKRYLSIILRSCVIMTTAPLRRLELL